MPPADVQVDATCRGESAHARVYVADSAWGSDVTEAKVSAVLAAFDQATPADPSRGIFAIDQETFGDPPDVDGEPRVLLFYVPMDDYKGYSFDGFFRDDDQAPGATSNQSEMLHLSSHGAKAVDSDYMLGVVAHELVHLITWKYDPADEGWLGETLAEVAMVRAGYLTDLPAAQSYVKATATKPLCVKSYSDYGATFAFGTYLLDRFGAPFVKSVTQDAKDGRESVEAQLPGGLKFGQLFGEFMVATLLDQPKLGDGRFGFDSIDVSGLGSEVVGKLDGSSGSVDCVAFGGRTLRLNPSGAGKVSVTLTASNLSELVVHSVVMNPSSPGSAKVLAQNASAGPMQIGVGAGESVFLVIAVDPGAALPSAQGAPVTQIGYTATFTP